MPQKDSWGGGKTYKNSNGDKIEIWEDDVHISLNLMNFNEPLFQKIYDICVESDLLYVDLSSGESIPADWNKLIKNIKSSDAFEYCSNPKKYIENLSRDFKGM